MTATTLDPRTLDYYTRVAANYGDAYGDNVHGPGGYPANARRWELVRHRLKELGAKTVLEAGCGEGTPLTVVRDELGVEVWGFDMVPAMVEGAKKRLGEDRAWLGDICEPWEYPHSKVEPINVDAVIALGPLPHLTDEQQLAALRNSAAVIPAGGSVFVELRNELFSFFTLNSYSEELFDRLITPEAPEFVRRRLHDHFSPLDASVPSRKPGHYSSTRTRFNNPLTAPALFEQAGLSVVKIHPYHAHAYPPRYEEQDRETFHRESLKLEWPNPEYADWPNLFRCSAFVVEAIRE